MSHTAGLPRLESWRRTHEVGMVMRVFMAGGTGVVGRRLVPQLVAQGHQVTATTTSADKLGFLQKLRGEAVVMDGLDAESVGEAVAAARPDAIVHHVIVHRRPPEGPDPACRATAAKSPALSSHNHPDIHADPRRSPHVNSAGKSQQSNDQPLP